MRPDRAVKSAKRALEVVELLEKLRRPANVNEIATRLEYPQSSMSTLLSGLRRLGYLQYDGEHRTYALSLRVALIGSGLRFGGQPVSHLLDLVTHVCNVTGLTTTISTRNEIYIQYIHTTPGERAGIGVYEPGKLQSLFRSAAGFALLSQASESELGKIVRRVNAEVADQAPVGLKAVSRDVQQFRSAGYICVTNRVLPGFGSVAIRLPFDDTSGGPLAMSVGGPDTIVVAEEESLARFMGEAVAQFGWDVRTSVTRNGQWPPVAMPPARSRVRNLVHGTAADS